MGQIKNIKLHIVTDIKVKKSNKTNKNNNRMSDDLGSPRSEVSDTVLPWSKQKERMDAILLNLKTELKEVKNTDKVLTKQFIRLGGKINELKEVKAKQMEYELNGDEMVGIDDIDENVFADQ